jgi:hypothetical protein
MADLFPGLRQNKLGNQFFFPAKEKVSMAVGLNITLREVVCTGTSRFVQWCVTGWLIGNDASSQTKCWATSRFLAFAFAFVEDESAESLLRTESGKEFMCDSDRTRMLSALARFPSFCGVTAQGLIDFRWKTLARRPHVPVS